MKFSNQATCKLSTLMRYASACANSVINDNIQWGHQVGPDEESIVLGRGVVKTIIVTMTISCCTGECPRGRMLVCELLLLLVPAGPRGDCRVVWSCHPPSCPVTSWPMYGVSSGTVQINLYACKPISTIFMHPLCNRHGIEKCLRPMEFGKGKLSMRKCLTKYHDLAAQNQARSSLLNKEYVGSSVTLGDV